MPSRGDLKRIRGEVRQELTTGERAFLYGMVVLVVALPPLAIGLLLFGGSGLRGAGIELLIAAFVVYAVPASPILRARARGRETRARQNE